MSLHFQQRASYTAAGKGPFRLKSQLFRFRGSFHALARTMQYHWAGEMKMLSDEPRNRAAATVRILALGLVCALTASGALAAITPAHDCGALNGLACECCRTSDATNVYSVGRSSCCDAPDPVKPAPAAAELANSQRVEDLLLNQVHEGDAGSRAYDVALGSIDLTAARASGPHSYILLCSFLI